METEPDSILSFCSDSIFLLWALPPLELVVEVLAILLLLMGSALVSGSEVAFFSLTPNDFERLQQENLASSRRILWLKDKPRRLLATILISNNFINIAIVLLSELVLRRMLSTEILEGWAAGLQNVQLLSTYSISSLSTTISFLITVVGVTFLLVLFGEVSPKVYARFNRIGLARTMSGPLIALMQIFRPFSNLLVSITEGLEARLVARTNISAFTSREDIDEAIDLTVSNELDSEQDIDILKRIVKFSDVAVRQIMRSRMDVVALDKQSRYDEVLTLIRESGYSRIPVYENDFDNVFGILYVKDLLGRLNEPTDFSWQGLVRTNVLFVPEAKKINDLLREFQKQHLHMAVVVDEYGGSSGIVTLEDILEEVIGDIKDEFDDEPEVIYQKVDDYNYIFDGKTLLNDVCRIVGVDTDTFEPIRGESDSFAGLVLEMVGALPKKQQELEYEDFRFKVIAVSDRRIERILLTLPTPEPDLDY